MGGDAKGVCGGRGRVRMRMCVWKGGWGKLTHLFCV